LQHDFPDQLCSNDGATRIRIGRWRFLCILELRDESSRARALPGGHAAMQSINVVVINPSF
jgi:hypothetical protein